MGKYDDIINLKRPASKHPKMSLYQRSAQFAPYSALTGYEGQVKETARLTDRRIELDKELKVILDMKIQVIQELISNKPVAPLPACWYSIFPEYIEFLPVPLWQPLLLFQLQSQIHR